MIQNLSGTMLIEANDGVVRGFDSSQLSAEMSRLDRYADFIDLADTAMNGGQSRYTSIGGGVKFENGVGRLDDFKAVFDGSRATAQGSVDLPRWAVDLELALSLTGKENAKAPPVTLTLAGPLDAPDQKTHLGAVGKYVGKKLVKTVIDDALGTGDPHGDDLPPEERKAKTKRVVNKLIDKLERRRNRVTRHEPEPSYDDQYAYPDGYPPYQDEDPSYRDEPGYGQRDEYAAPPAAPGYRLDPRGQAQPRQAQPYEDYPPDGYDSSGRDGGGYEEYPPDGGYGQGYGPGPSYSYPDGRY
jgi:hypothetical protein